MKKAVGYSVFSDPGNREINEDNVGAFNQGNRYCFVLCDGLGGHGLGEVASRLAVDVFENQFYKYSDSIQLLKNSFYAAQDIILTEQRIKNASQKMKTTAVALVIDNNKAAVGHIGDSRLYAFSHNKVKFHTMDHSIPQMLVLSKEIKESQIRNHPERNILLRTIGVNWEKQEFELKKPFSIKNVQAFLLCSDGFWELIEENEMCSLLKQARVHQQQNRRQRCPRLLRRPRRGRQQHNPLLQLHRQQHQHIL